MADDLTIELHWCKGPFNHDGCNNVGKVSFSQAPRVLQARKIADGLALTIPLDVTIDSSNNLPQCMLARLQAVVRQKGTEICVAHDMNTYYPGTHTTGALVARLPSHIVHHIERTRAGGPARFDLQVQAELYRLLQHAEGHIVLLSNRQPNGLVTVTYPKETWVSMLNESGFGENVVVEIPLPPNPNADWQPIWKSVATARDALKYDGTTSWKSVIMECRKALEDWQKFEKEDHGAGWKAPPPADREARTRQQRLDNLRWDLLQCAHETAHTSADKWTRDDAVLILATLAALLAIRNP